MAKRVFVLRNIHYPMLLSALIFAAAAWSQSDPELYIVGQVQSGIEDGGSSVAEYQITKGELQTRRELLRVKGGGLTENIKATDEVQDFFFMSYPNYIPTYVSVYNWRTDKLYSPINIDPEGKGTIDNGRDYSEINDVVCANWPLTNESPMWNQERRQWVGGSETLSSLCVGPLTEPSLVKNQWEKIIRPLWPGGAIGSNIASTTLLHLNDGVAIPPTLGAAPVTIATVPGALSSDAPRNVLDLAASDKQYLVLRSSWGRDQATLYVLDQVKNTWSTSKGIGKFSSYRIFGSLLVGSSEIFTPLEGDPQQRMTTTGTAMFIIDLARNRRYALPGVRDSEVVDIEPDQTVIYREGATLYKTTVGASLDRSRDVIAHGDNVETIHWAFYR